MADPSTAEEWLDVARERGLDAESMLTNRAASVGPAYMAGYAVESALKAYLQAQGIPRPTSGPAGHDLRALWKACGLRLSDIKDVDGSAAYFIKDWTTALRYQTGHPSAHSSQTLVNAAKRLVGILTKRARR